ncbi:GNAT family N-acetyltransferase [uncultured Oxalicibacterium sp.]|uniref:GNAT family N-acetyltransferase n=1 Tax=uncultured Oxalicibacterium sp. TaxID=1168540 RepID=UPI0025DFF182|nr:GNAT family N-acetyltransferase [uncultured Oxalicibacterium sp.]
MNPPLPKRSTQAQRLTIEHDGSLLGFVDYYALGGAIVITHTETNPALTGKGHGSQLAEQAIAHFRTQPQPLVPICSFFAHYLRTHPKHHDMMTANVRQLFAMEMQD